MDLYVRSPEREGEELARSTRLYITVKPIPRRATNQTILQATGLHRSDTSYVDADFYQTCYTGGVINMCRCWGEWAYLV